MSQNNHNRHTQSITYPLAASVDDYQSLSLAIVDAIAAFSNTDPADLDPLYYSIDTEALNTLFTLDDDRQVAARRVTFTHAGYEITIDTAPDPTITVTHA